MSYTPNNWTTGDVITAAKLNNIEQGIANAGSVMFVGFDVSTSKFDKTWTQLKTALDQGIICLTVLFDDERSEIDIITRAEPYDSSYAIWLNFAEYSDDPYAVAQTADDYPERPQH